MNYHGGCARNAGLKQAIDRVPKLKVIDPKADPRLMGARARPPEGDDTRNMDQHTHSHPHPHDHDHPHPHTHSHTQTKAVLNRLSRAQGHLESVRKMVERGEDCAEVLVQLAAVISALNSTGRVILKDHIAHCIVDAVESGDNEAVESLNQAIDRFMR